MSKQNNKTWRKVSSLVILSCLSFNQVFAESSYDYSTASYGSVSLTANPLSAPECKRPSSISTITATTNAKYDEQKAPKQTQLATVESQITSAQSEVSSKLAQYQAAQKNSTLSPTQLANYQTQYETAVANLANYQSQKSQLASDIIGIEELRQKELENIEVFKQYDTVEAYLQMAVFNEESIYGSKGLEIMAVADVGRRLSCNQIGDTASESYSLFKSASNAYSVNFSEDVNNYMSSVQESLIEECQNISDAKEAQYASLQLLLDRQNLVLEAINDQLISVQTLADSYLPALEAARLEESTKATRVAEAEAWVAEAEGKVAAAQKKVDEAKEKVKQAEQDLEDAEKELEQAKADEADAEKQKTIAYIAAAAALAMALACSGVCTATWAKYTQLALVLAAAVIFLTAKKADVEAAEAKVEEMKAALKTAEEELAAAEEELAIAEEELAQALAELELANIHASLTCSVSGASELLQSLSSASANSNADSLDTANANADGLMLGYVSTHTARQPSEFPEIPSRIAYLEYIVSLSSSGVAQLEDVKSQAEAYIEEITGIMTQMSGIAITDYSTAYDTTYCLDSKGNLDTDCSCKLNNSCLSATLPSDNNNASNYSNSNSSGTTATTEASSTTGFVSSGTSGTDNFSSSGSFNLAQAVNEASKVQLEYANATFTGNKAAAKVAREKLKKIANNLRENNPKNKELLSGTKSDTSYAASIGTKAGISSLGTSFADIGGSLKSVALESREKLNKELKEISPLAKLGKSLVDLISGKKSSKDNNLQREPAQEKIKTNVDPLDLAQGRKLKSDTQVSDADQGSIFEIITARYQKTAYPRFLNKEE
jgi:hypothetical protein